MTCNMGKTDRIVRGILGVLILAGGLYFRSWWGLVGLLPLVTSIMAWCGLYVPFRIDTRARSER